MAMSEQPIRAEAPTELDLRASDGVEVSALDVFRHPYAYAAQRPVPLRAA
jgi:hypothetical protein